MKRYIITFLLAFCALGYASAAQNKDVTRVYAVFKTHLDVGFTDLSSVVENAILPNLFLKPSKSEKNYAPTAPAKDMYGPPAPGLYGTISIPLPMRT